MRGSRARDEGAGRSKLHLLRRLFLARRHFIVPRIFEHIPPHPSRLLFCKFLREISHELGDPLGFCLGVFIRFGVVDRDFASAVHEVEHVCLAGADLPLQDLLLLLRARAR
jgi:hypothetical protein